MSLNQSLSVATNALCVIAFLAPVPASATKIAEQIDVHPVVIRRAVGKLVSAGLVTSIAGAHGGYVLARDVCEITLHDVFSAMSDKGIFERSNASPRANCTEGKAISDAIASIFSEAEGAFAQILKHKTIGALLRQADST